MFESTGFFSILLIAVGLSADCFAVAVSGGICNTACTAKQILRASLSFGLFQAVMPVLGWVAGSTVEGFISDYDHWVALGLLALVSGRMLWEAFRHKKDAEKAPDITGGLSLLVLSVATSIDALAVGMSFALLQINIAAASVTIGVVAVAATALGFVIGRRAGAAVGKWAEIAGAVILLAIAIRILLSHIL